MLVYMYLNNPYNRAILDDRAANCTSCALGFLWEAAQNAAGGEIIAYKPTKRQPIPSDVKCKYCGSSSLVRYGKYRGTQQYMCRDCNRKSADNRALPGMQMPPEVIGTALSLFYEGASCASIRRQLWHIYHVEPSKSTIYNWWVEYTKKATELASDSKPKIGKSWVVNETVSKIGSDNTWFWDVIDPDTKFLISSHVSDTRGTEDVEAVMKKAQDKTIEPPEFIIPDKLADYIEGIERVFGTDMWYKESQGFVGRIVIKPIAGSQGILRDRAKIMNGLKSINTVKIATDGWLVHYNFFRPQPSLENKTPSEVARIKFPYRDWTEIVRGGKKPW